jgi:hypothetical protein
MFRRRTGSLYWHWHNDCPAWPQRDYVEKGVRPFGCRPCPFCEDLSLRELAELLYTREVGESTTRPARNSGGS